MIRKLLVANRGEIARRVFRTCRRMNIETVAVYSDPDTTEPHVIEANHAVNLPGSTPSETYLDIDAVLGAAKQTGADAVHPGYGFLAENAEFARRVIDAGLTWIGPSPEAIEVMGSKLRSKALVESAGVPTLLAVDLTAMDEGRAMDAAAGLGYPVLVKASAGGGGKGMRIVADPSGLPEAIEGARGRQSRPLAMRLSSWSGTWRHRVISRSRCLATATAGVVSPLRAGVLHPTAASEDHRGGAVTSRRR